MLGRRGWLTKEDAFDVRRKLAIEGTVYLEVNHDSGRARPLAYDPSIRPEPEPSSSVADVPIPTRRGKRVDPAKLLKARKR